MNPQLQIMLQQGIQAFQNGNFDGADSILKRIIQVDPKNLPALHVLGLIKASQNKYKEAADLLSRAARLNPSDASIQYNLAKALMDSGFDKESIPHHKKAVELNPNNPDAWLNYGKAQSALHFYEEAIIAYDKALLLEPNYAEAYLNKGATLKELRRYEEAGIAFDHALSVNPNDFKVLASKGIILYKLGRYREAIVAYDSALSIKQDDFEILANKGMALKALGLYDQALTHYNYALLFKPDDYEVLTNKGIALHEQQHLDQAIAIYDKVLNLNGSYYQVWGNKGVAYHGLKCFERALASYDSAITLKPNYHEAVWNKSLTLLLQGDFERGLPLYESRWSSDSVSKVIGNRRFDKPCWAGTESLKDKSILLYGEQGLGDFIQFCRYAKLVSELGARVILEVPDPLVTLLSDLDGVSQLVIKEQELPSFDFQCPLLSLPLAFKTNLSNIPSAQKYLSGNFAAVTEWEARLGQKTKPRIGLVWSGNPDHKNDYNRSLALKDLLPYLPEHYEYISLQKEVREADQLTLELNTRIRNFSQYLKSFGDSAALIECLDLVISVDTSVAHLSGALGKKTWVLLPFVPDWRWLLDRSDTPWYPSISLYRQEKIGDWAGVLEKIQIDVGLHIH
ncbi:tetratricopeptide repeat protein [Polynucleobacter sp. MG-5-Ahmo-C2]|uniref:tetratricopeptide repeat protein n=1 Tax=Polynucleobacter sp. MG-5-Ahmo-C2 TaxID=2081051 RepID=UPI001BFD9E80|nr:tetratricopeptide repeat protein [Polynucleobacter sp. MG-5-Ahmo-C2]QWD98283.1 tetratricopeptide repeat protein [Polynucleobacter sp. MG-5-Ahmo-C2]